MATTTTTPIPVTILYCTSARIILSITNPAAPLYMYQLTITPLNPAPGGIIGNVQPGAAGHPVSHTVSVGQAKFTSIFNFIVQWHSSFALEVTYDSTTYAATDAEVGGATSFAAAKATLANGADGFGANAFR